MDSVTRQVTVEHRGGRATSLLTKKRFHEIEEMLSVYVPDAAELAAVMLDICTIMNFNPSKKVYNEGYLRRTQEYVARKKLREQRDLPALLQEVS